MYKEGNSVTILYNIEEPSQFLIKGDKGEMILSIILPLIGVAAILYGAYLLFKN